MMRKKMPLFFMALVSILMNKGNVYANNVDNFGIGSKASSLGGAFTAAADDPYAVFYNPAGLGQSQKSSISAGAVVLNPHLELDNYGSGNIYSNHIQDHSDNSISPHIGFTIPVNSKITFGAAAYVPYGLMIKWDKNPGNNPGAYNCFESWYMREVVTPSVSYEITENLYVGAGISLGKSQAGRKFISQGLSAKYKTEILIETDIKDSFNYSYNLGILYKPLSSLSLGLTYRSMTDADFKGDLKIKSDIFENTQSFDAAMETVDHPAQIQAGIKYDFLDKFSLFADVLWINWSSVEDEKIFFKNISPQIMEVLGTDREKFARDWNDTTQVKLGLEYRLNDILSLRCGYFNDPSPIPDKSFDLEWPGSDKKTYTIGAGLEYDKWSFDAVMIYSKADVRNINKGESDNLNHSYITGDVSAKAYGHLFGSGITITYFFD
jgi:long-chain fatty acid transport protein